MIDETLFGTGCAFELATSVGVAQCNIQRGFSRGTGKRAHSKNMRDKAQATTDSERIRQLENENAKLREERDILRKAAKYFAEETRW